MSMHLQRGRMLMIQHRPKEALEHLQQAVGEDPSNPMAHILMVDCHLDLEDPRAALVAAQEALALEPAWDTVHHCLARVHLAMGKHKLALKSAEDAVAIEPDDADNHALRGVALYNLGRYEPALASFDAGLALDPENAECNTLRAHTLIKLNRVPDAHQTLGATLGRDPENPYTHSAMGWTNLHAGNPQAAMTHFQEALRLDPTHEESRAGMIEALKSQYRVYGLFLGFMLWLNRLSATYRWGVIVGIWLAQEALQRVEQQWPVLAPFATPLLWVLILLCVSTWFFDPFFSGLLLFRREGRLALNRHEAIEGGIVIGVVALSLALVIFRLYTGLVPVTYISLGTLGIAILVRGLFEYRIPWQRTIWLGTSTALILALAATIVLLLIGWATVDSGLYFAALDIMNIYWRGMLAAVIMTWFFRRH